MLKCLTTHMPHPPCIIKVLHLVTNVQLTVIVKATAYIVLATLIRLVFMTSFNFKATPINDTNDS